MTESILQLYVAGNSVSSQRARERVVRLCQNELKTWQLEIIDILAEPEKAEEALILATPTLVSRKQGQERRVVGDLSDGHKVLEFLGVGGEQRTE